MEIGDTWNESESYRDELTGRLVRRLTSRGRINQTPTYHTNSGFTANGSSLAFASVREGRTWIIRADVESGDLTALWKTEGIGDRNYIHRGMSLDFADVDGRGICGNRVCMAPRSQVAVFSVGRQMLAVDVRTSQARVILDDCGDEWIFGAPCVSPDEQYVAVALSSSHPEMRGGEWTLNPQKAYGEYAHSLRIVRIPLAGCGKMEVLYEHQTPAQSAHCAFCPTDGNLLYFDLDLPPRYWSGGDGQTPRIWLLDVEARNIRPLKEEYPGPFQIHQAWLWDGSALCYHGHVPTGGGYFGIADIRGNVVWEEVFSEALTYGHNTPDARRNALIIDGMFSRDKLQWLYWDRGSGEAPALEPICIHGTEWGSIPGQYSHPHPLTDADGKWVSFTSARGGRSDIFVADISQ
ncbi:MAG: hypothetical protein HOC74_16500 [Gemmatimonadetes bacterium]|nr:hypothetical protein [Gemmatimonadota bacterium]